MTDLDERLLAAHASGDKTALVSLYSQAADQATQPAARAFYLTQAYVFALEIGNASAPRLYAQLVNLNCDT